MWLLQKRICKSCTNWLFFKDAKKAFRFAFEKQNDFFKKSWELGEAAIKDLEKSPDEFAIVLMGRWYNALAKEANMSIPHKIASRGVRVITYDFLPFTTKKSDVYMNWGIGKTEIQVSKRVKYHPQLFATYVTNFFLWS